MNEEFDRDELKDLVRIYKDTCKKHNEAIVRTDHLDEDDFNEETYDLAVGIEETKTEVIDYVTEHLVEVKKLDNEYVRTALELYEESIK